MESRWEMTLNLLQHVTHIGGKLYRFVIAMVPLSIFLRHSDSMVQKLETAGLGFFLRENEKIPMLGIK